MKKFLLAVFVVLAAIGSVNAQSMEHPRSKVAYESLTPEQKAKIRAMKAKIKAMTPAEREIYFSQNAGSEARFHQLSAEKQAEIKAMKEQIKAMTPAEREAYFSQNVGRPKG